MLSIKNICKQYGNKKVLNSVSLNVKRGHIAFLLGSSGVGKSTLLRILNNLETIDSGTITLDGQLINVQEVNQTHLVGMVFQHFNLFEHLTVKENITLALEKVLNKSKKEADAIALKLLNHYSLADKSNYSISQLSGGQKQRIALARALALEPKIICLDEPTSALDPLLTNYIAQTIMQLAQDGYMVLVASHDVGLLAKLDCTIYLMEQGNIIESIDSKLFKQQPDVHSKIERFVKGME